jgi:hypothetical protein
VDDPLPVVKVAVLDTGIGAEAGDDLNIAAWRLEGKTLTVGKQRSVEL